MLLPLVVLAAPLQRRDDGLVLFADAFVGAHTGGHYTDCSTLAAAASLGATTGWDRANAFNNWAFGQCHSAYNNNDLCSGLSAYLSATFWAYENNWAAVDLFASLGSTRVNRWHDDLTGLCGINGCPQDYCGTITTQWTTYYSSYTSVTSQQCADQTTAFNNYGIYTFIDAYLNVQTSLYTSVGTNGYGYSGSNTNLVTSLTGGLSLGGILGGENGGDLLNRDDNHFRHGIYGGDHGHDFDYHGGADASIVAGAAVHVGRYFDGSDNGHDDGYLVTELGIDAVLGGSDGFNHDEII